VGKNRAAGSKPARASKDERQLLNLFERLTATDKRLALKVAERLAARNSH
jgi:hypothetical protein